MTRLSFAGHAFWVFVQSSAFAAQTYYVAPSGNDANQGSLSQPFRQIRKALTRVGPGDTVVVADGSFLGFDIDTIGGNAAEPIRIQAAGANAIILPTTDRSDNRDTIFIVDSAYVIVEGLRSFGANRAALRIEGGDHITIRNCVFGLKQTTGTNYVRNNILSNRHSFRGGLQFGDLTDANNTDTDYNVLNYITTDDGNSRLSLAQWQAQGRDLHSVTGALASLFVDANSGNYLLLPASPAVNAALPLAGVTDDFEGNPRPSGAAPDIGCYELSPFFLRLIQAAGNLQRLILFGGAGKVYQIETTTVLTNWSSVASWVRSNQPIELALTNSEPYRFFRASYLP